MNRADLIDPSPLMGRRSLLQAGSLVLLLGAAQIARGASIVAVRVWPAPDYTRVTIESDTLLKSAHQFVASPPRLAVDLEGVELSPACASWWPKSGPTTPSSAASASARMRPASCGW